MHIFLQQTTCSYPNKENVYKAIITTKPEIKEKSILYHSYILKNYNSSVISTGQKKALLYFTQDSINQTLKCGDEILFSARLSLPPSNEESEFFDYNRYLIHKGVSGTAFITSNHWQFISNHSFYSVQEKALAYRDKILEFYRKLGFSNDEFAVLSALTVGYKDELSEEIRESFSISGASHVLALSGLHIGFLYGFIFFFLKRLLPGSSSTMNLMRAIIAIILLWIFAFITGLPASVVRSVIMFSLLAISLFFTDRVISLNTLSVAGVGMLLYNPCWLFDAGFQLSFCAVTAILLIQPKLYKTISVQNRFLKQFWGLITVSIAAQIGTAPLVLFYFSRFSVHFLLTNILVIPLVTIIIYAAVIMLLCAPLPILCQYLAIPVKGLIWLLNSSVHQIENLPFASIDNIWVYQAEVILIYVALLLFINYTTKRKSKYIFAFLSTLLILFGYRSGMILQDRPQQSIVFYNIRNCPVVHCISSDGNSWLAYADSVPDEKRLSRTAFGFWNKHQLKRPVNIGFEYKDTQIIRHNHILTFKGKKVGIINDDYWNNKTAKTPLKIDYLYLCKGYMGRVEWLTHSFILNHVILDSSLSDSRKNALVNECNNLGINCTSLSEQAALYKKAV